MRCCHLLFQGQNINKEGNYYPITTTFPCYTTNFLIIHSKVKYIY